MTFRKSVIKLSICIITTLFSLPSVADVQALNLKSLYIIKGSITDYLPTIFETYRVKHLLVHQEFIWAGDLYLQNQNPSKGLMQHKADYYNKAVRFVEADAFVACRKALANTQIKNAFVVVDHFEFSPVYKDGYSSFSYGGNVICLTLR